VKEGDGDESENQREGGRGGVQEWWEGGGDEEGCEVRSLSKITNIRNTRIVVHKMLARDRHNDGKRCSTSQAHTAMKMVAFAIFEQSLA
jgi:hypothetical protein